MTLFREVLEPIELMVEKGNDTLIASFALGSVSFRDYAVDTIVCGSGFDTAYISSVDGDSAATDCEEIITETGQ